jgi:hypothetical protein
MTNTKVQVVALEPVDLEQVQVMWSFPVHRTQLLLALVLFLLAPGQRLYLML